MTQEDLESLGNASPNLGLERYFEACLSVLRASLTQVSEAVDGIPLPQANSRSSTSNNLSEPESGAMPNGAWYPARGGKLPPGRHAPPPIAMEGVGFHLVGIVRLAHFLLIAFQWQETGEAIYVYVVDLREYAEKDIAAGLVNTVVLSHLLEKIRPHWHAHAETQVIHGLTFIK